MLFANIREYARLGKAIVGHNPIKVQKSLVCVVNSIEGPNKRPSDAGV